MRQDVGAVYLFSPSPFYLHFICLVIYLFFASWYLYMHSRDPSQLHSAYVHWSGVLLMANAIWTSDRFRKSLTILLAFHRIILSSSNQVAYNNVLLWFFKSISLVLRLYFPGWRSTNWCLSQSLNLHLSYSLLLITLLIVIYYEWKVRSRNCKRL
jgi:hypothetical protein